MGPRRATRSVKTHRSVNNASRDTKARVRGRDVLRRRERERERETLWMDGWTGVRFPFLARISLKIPISVASILLFLHSGIVVSLLALLR